MGAAIECEPNRSSIVISLRKATLELDDQTRREMGAAGRSLVQAHFDWSFIAQQMISVYEWLLGGSRPDTIFLA
jgi:hypothetical protein